MNEYTEEQVREMLKAMCAKRGGQRLFASEHGLSQQFINDVVRGRRDVTAAVAEAMGGQRVVVFRFDKEQDKCREE